MIPTAVMTRAFEDRFDLMYLMAIGVGASIIVTTIIAYFSPKECHI
ncbi:hypothetical protein MASR2M54_15070 [Aliarcobacter cryaerophilus]